MDQWGQKVIIEDAGTNPARQKLCPQDPQTQ